MRKCMFVFGVCASLAAASAYAHGPQIQITNDSNKIVTREIVDESSYSTALSYPKSVYVMPLAQYRRRVAGTTR